jgi:geranylgeranyl reductase family protein
MFDVIIAGAGPAGAVAATMLARTGMRVLLLDRARFPRDKLCGDTINPGTLALLRRHGLTSRLESRALRIDGMLLTGEGRVSVRAEYRAGRHGWAVQRRDLDAALVAEACAAGARFEEATAVRRPLVESAAGKDRVRGLVISTRTAGDLRVPAPLVIAADGRHSTLAFALGLAHHPTRPRRWAVGGYFEDVDGLSNVGEMHVRHGHYIGVAPLPSGLANVCFVTSARGGFTDPAALLRDSVARDEQLAPRFERARLVGRPAVIGPLAVDASAGDVAGVLLAGDAAGFIDPMTGDGLRFAVEGALLAARAAVRAFRRPAEQPHLALVRMRRRAFGAKWRFNRCLRTLVSSDVALQLAGRTASVAPSLLRQAVNVAGDVRLA